MRNGMRWDGLCARNAIYFLCTSIQTLLLQTRRDRPSGRMRCAQRRRENLPLRLGCADATVRDAVVLSWVAC